MLCLLRPQEASSGPSQHLEISESAPTRRSLSGTIEFKPCDAERSGDTLRCSPGIVHLKQQVCQAFTFSHLIFSTRVDFACLLSPEQLKVSHCCRAFILDSLSTFPASGNRLCYFSLSCILAGLPLRFVFMLTLSVLDQTQIDRCCNGERNRHERKPWKMYE